MVTRGALKVCCEGESFTITSRLAGFTAGLERSRREKEKTRIKVMGTGSIVGI